MYVNSIQRNTTIEVVVVVVVEVTFMKSVVAVAPAPSTQARCRTTSYYSCGAFFSNKGWPLHSIWIVTYTTTRGAAFTILLRIRVCIQKLLALLHCSGAASTVSKPSCST